jgi:hypothetical protein
MKPLTVVVHEAVVGHAVCEGMVQVGVVGEGPVAVHAAALGTVGVVEVEGIVAAVAFGDGMVEVVM